MGIFNKQKTELSAHTPVGLTELGQRTAESVMARGQTFAILSALAEHNPRSISDLARETNINIEEMKERIKIMAREGYVRVSLEQ